jgi:hypothetical protein
MRYNCQALYTLDEVAAQCKASILKAQAQKEQQIADRLYAEVLTFYRWEDDVLRLIPEPIAA